MKSNLDFDFRVNKEDNTILIIREFAAELPLVWDAYTKPEIIDQWWAPKPWKAKTKTMDFREGGFWHYAMVGPEGEEHWGYAKFGKINVNKKYTGTDCFCDADANVNAELPQSTWEVTFSSSSADVTLVEYAIRYDDLAQLEATIEMGFKEGMTMALDGLDVVLASFKK
jgi:uncharacterized protein YndB with AHSA1/START domain